MKSVLLILSILFAADLFSGKWKGEIAAGPCGGFGAPGGGPPGGGFPGGAGGDRRGGTQKVTLNIKAKEDKKSAEAKLSGNITIGDNTEDIRDGKIDGFKISFVTGKPPKPVCQYAGEFNTETRELRITRKIVGSNSGEVSLTLKR